jgi:CTP:molybdopterin cytidylyltransferase MocA
MEPPQLVAVVLAGGGRGDRLAASLGVRSKALVRLRDVPMGAYVAHALRHSGVVDRIVWVGASEPQVEQWVDQVLPSGERMVDSFALGMGAALASHPGAPPPQVLVVSADIPWWTAEGVRRFVREAPAVDVVYPVVSEAVARAQFPNQKRTYVKLRDGRFTGGNAVLMSAAAVVRLLPLIDAAFAARKQPLALARLIGFATLLSVLLGRGRIVAIERRIGALVGLPVQAYHSPDASIAADVDDPSHLPTTLTLPPLIPDPTIPGGVHAPT